MIRDYIRRKLLTIRWRRRNRHNETAPNSVFDINTTTVGNHTYGRIDVMTFNGENKLCIGNFCSIGPKVLFILSADHHTDCISTYPYKAKIVTGENEGISKGNIVVEDDVWIGCGATILSGVHIGQGAVIAAGAVVSKDVPPYAIIGGVPAKVIKYRFSKPVIDYLLTLDYSSLTEDIIKLHIDSLYTPIDGMELDEIKKQYDWFPKKKRDEETTASERV